MTKIKYTNILSFAILSMLLLSGCSGGEDDPKNIHKGTLLYIIADNNLNNECIDNINKLELGVTGKENGRIFVFLDARSTGDYPNPTIFEIRPDKKAYKPTEKDEIISKVVKTYSRLDACSMETFEMVINDIKRNYPSLTIENLILSSHGSAWVPVGSTIYKSPAQYSFGQDDSAKTEMDIKDMAETFEKYKFKTIIFDACHMAAVEVFYQLRNCANYLIASAAPIYSEGFPYKALANHFANSDISPLYVTNEYYNFYKEGGESLYSGGTIVYADCSQLEKLAFETKKIISLHHSSLDNASIVPTLSSYGEYRTSLIYDFKQYIDKTSSKGVDLNDFNLSWRNAIKNYRYTNQRDIGLNFDNTFGLTFYAPLNSIPDVYNDYYQTLDWAKDSGFDLFF